MTVLQNEIEFLLVLKTGKEFDYEWMVNVHKHVSLNFNVVLLFPLFDFLLLQYLHSV